MKSQVICKIQVEGFHNYVGAPKQVEFLKDIHRHTFEITFAYDVKHLNRDVEIFIQRDEVKDYLHEAYGNPCMFEGMSCEHIAKEILEFIEEDGGAWVEVWEETTGGARIEK